MTGYRIIHLIICVLLVSSAAFLNVRAQPLPTLPYVEDFETDGSTTRYTASHSFFSSPNDHFQRTDGTSDGQAVDATSGKYSGISGTYFWAGEDLNDSGGDGIGHKTLTLQTIDVSGASNLRFTGRFAAGCNDGVDNSCYDSGDSLVVRYSTDGGATFTTALQFAYAERIDTDGTVDRYNEPLAQDLNFDGNGEGTHLTPAMQTFGAALPTPAETIIIQIGAYFTSSGEEFAFDHLRVEAQPLPVELSVFEAHAADHSIALTWRTLTETDNAGFEIEHRSPASTTWKSLGFVAGAGNASTPRAYRFATDVLGAGTHRFRLRQRDLDGTTALSPVRTATIRPRAILRIVSANPLRSGKPLHVIVHTERHRSVDIALFNVLGQRVRSTRSDDATSDGARVSLATDGLASGLYFVRATGPGIRETERVAIVR